MALSNRDRISRGFELLAEGLEDPVDDVMTGAFGGRADWNVLWADRDGRGQTMSKKDPQVQLRAITEFGREFAPVLSRPQQAYASELRETRNLFAHSEPFSSDDTIRALDTMERLLLAVSAPHSAEDVRKLRLDTTSTMVAERARTEVRRSAAKATSVPGSSGLRPWREVVRPHEDVTRGQFVAAEFAADLWAVSTGATADPGYANAREFFARTYLTEGLRDLLNRALRRVVGDGTGSPVVNLQTNFGGGKTHSMLALWHLFGNTPVTELPQEVQELIAAAGASTMRDTPVRRVAIVGIRMRAGSASIKEDGTEVRTTWGELAWQLGGRAAYEIVADDDRAGTNPGQALHTLLQAYGPALILIDEWVAYGRDLVGKDGLPGGSFDTQFTFAQTLSETVGNAPGVMLVVSIPASETGELGQGDDNEIGGTNGQLALERLQNAIRRVADQWRPSSKDESFEIVRRRLFQDPGADARAAIAATAKAFVGMYRADATLFPRDVSVPDFSYENRIRDSYPLHPQLLDRLYEDWSTLGRFQRTRGVLRLVSSIVHELWQSEDSSALILPASVPLSATSVNADLTQYLSDSWRPIIDSDIDGPAATSTAIDTARPSLGARHVTRRLARTVFMGSAPRAGAAHKGLDKAYVWLGTAIPGDPLYSFGAGLDALEQQSTYFYGDAGHYWFDTQASVTKTASDFAERLRDDPGLVWNEIVDRLRVEARAKGEFAIVHVAPESNADIPDLEDVRLVIVHPQWTWHSSDSDASRTGRWVRQAIESRGTAQRVRRNQLVFLLGDHRGVELLEAATRTYLGWAKVQSMAESLDLTVQQRKQTDDSVKRFSQTVSDRLSEAYKWIVYPTQADPKTAFTLTAEPVANNGKPLAVRVSDKLLHGKAELLTTLDPGYMSGELHRWFEAPWKGGHATAGALWDLFTKFPYLPRLTRRDVFDEAIRQAVWSVMAPDERFALAREWDDQQSRYRGLILPPQAGASIQVTDSTLIVDYGAAEAQIEGEYVPEVGPSGGGEEAGSAAPLPQGSVPALAISEEPAAMARFYGQVRLDPQRYSRDFGQITREVIERLVSAGANLDITVDVSARKPAGFTEAEVRTIGENARTLKFDPAGTGFAAD
jgi:predicted AAA+ superfamily ATPase